MSGERTRRGARSGMLLLLATTFAGQTFASAESTPTASMLAAACPPGRACITFEGSLKQGQRLTRPFGPGLTLLLEPRTFGWEIIVRDERPRENIARLTPPFHVVPNPRYIEGWHFRNADNSGPHDGSVNAPQREREFFFSPAVGRSMHYPPTSQQVEELQHAGVGRLAITSLALGNLRPGQRAHIERLRFRVSLSWRSAW